MGPHQNFTRIPLQVGSELRIRNNGEVSVSNPQVEGAPAWMRPTPSSIIVSTRKPGNTSCACCSLSRPSSTFLPRGKRPRGVRSFQHRAGAQPS